jgi:DNA-binding HxlR family transcriptional regulator
MSTTDALPPTELANADGAGHRSRPTRRSSCPVAGALDLVGDRWTLLVVRDLLRGKRRYGDLAASSERIPTNILADRLRRLEQGGVVERVQYSERPPRYEYRLTPRGEDLRPAIRSLATWGPSTCQARARHARSCPPSTLPKPRRPIDRQGELLGSRLKLAR